MFTKQCLNNQYTSLFKMFLLKVPLKKVTFFFRCQVVWNSSYKIGCGVKLCPNGIYFYACHYYRAYVILIYLPYP